MGHTSAKMAWQLTSGKDCCNCSWRSPRLFFWWVVPEMLRQDLKCPWQSLGRPCQPADNTVDEKSDLEKAEAHVCDGHKESSELYDTHTIQFVVMQNQQQEEYVCCHPATHRVHDYCKGWRYQGTTSTCTHGDWQRHNTQQSRRHIIMVPCKTYCNTLSLLRAQDGTS